MHACGVSGELDGYAELLEVTDCSCAQLLGAEQYGKVSTVCTGKQGLRLRQQFLG